MNLIRRTNTFLQVAFLLLTLFAGNACGAYVINHEKPVIGYVTADGAASTENADWIKYAKNNSVKNFTVMSIGAQWPNITRYERLVDAFVLGDWESSLSRRLNQSSKGIVVLGYGDFDTEWGYCNNTGDWQGGALYINSTSSMTFFNSTYYWFNSTGRKNVVDTYTDFRGCGNATFSTYENKFGCTDSSYTKGSCYALDNNTQYYDGDVSRNTQARLVRLPLSEQWLVRPELNLSSDYLLRDIRAINWVIEPYNNAYVPINPILSNENLTLWAVFNDSNIYQDTPINDLWVRDYAPDYANNSLRYGCCGFGVELNYTDIDGHKRMKMNGTGISYPSELVTNNATNIFFDSSASYTVGFEFRPWSLYQADKKNKNTSFIIASDDNVTNKMIRFGYNSTTITWLLAGESWKYMDYSLNESKVYYIMMVYDNYNDENLLYIDGLFADAVRNTYTNFIKLSTGITSIGSAQFSEANCTFGNLRFFARGLNFTEVMDYFYVDSSSSPAPDSVPYEDQNFSGINDMIIYADRYAPLLEVKYYNNASLSNNFSIPNTFSKQTGLECKPFNFSYVACTSYNNLNMISLNVSGNTSTVVYKDSTPTAAQAFSSLEIIRNKYPVIATPNGTAVPYINVTWLHPDGTFWKSNLIRPPVNTSIAPSYQISVIQVYYLNATTDAFVILGKYMGGSNEFFIMLHDGNNWVINETLITSIQSYSANAAAVQCPDIGNTCYVMYGNNSAFGQGNITYRQLFRNNFSLSSEQFLYVNDNTFDTRNIANTIKGCPVPNSDKVAFIFDTYNGNTYGWMLIFNSTMGRRPESYATKSSQIRAYNNGYAKASNWGCFPDYVNNITVGFFNYNGGGCNGNCTITNWYNDSNRQWAFSTWDTSRYWRNINSPYAATQAYKLSQSVEQNKTVLSFVDMNKALWSLVFWNTTTLNWTNTAQNITDNNRLMEHEASLMHSYVIMPLFPLNETSDHVSVSISWDFNLTIPLTHSFYSPSSVHQFNVTWNSTSEISSVLIEHNFTGALTNYSVSGNSGNVYYYNFGTLSAGSYKWKMYAEDINGLKNETPEFIYSINKISPALNLTLNNTEGNITVRAGSIVNITAIKVLGESFIELYVNNSFINNGTVVLSNLSTFNSTGLVNVTLLYITSANYSSAYTSYFITVLSNDTAVSEETVVVDDESPSNRGGGGGGGGGSGGAAGSNSASYKEILILSNITTNEEFALNIKNKNMALNSISCTSFITLKNPEFKIARLSDMPVVFSDLNSSIYQFLKIDLPITAQENSFKSCTIGFFINNTWITENSIDTNSIILVRQEGNATLQYLHAKFVRTDLANTYFTVNSPGMSYYAIIGNTIPAEPEKITGMAVISDEIIDPQHEESSLTPDITKKTEQPEKIGRLEIIAQMPLFILQISDFFKGISYKIHLHIFAIIFCSGLFIYLITSKAAKQCKNKAALDNKKEIKSSLNQGKIYFINEKEKEKSLPVFNELVKWRHGLYVLPAHCKTELKAIHTISYLFLTFEKTDNSVNPNDIKGLYDKLTAFILKDEKSAVLIHGFDLLIKNSNFETVIYAIDVLQEFISDKKTIVFISLNLNSQNKKNRDIIRSKFSVM
ncbi:MAG: PGF-pre-PGF domain-containing protein [archaeon]